MSTRKKVEAALAKTFTKFDDGDLSDLTPRDPPQCPICILPLPPDPTQCTYMACCGNKVCGFCDYESQKAREQHNAKVDKNGHGKKMGKTCAFCRALYFQNYEEGIEMHLKRLEKGDDSNAFMSLGGIYARGQGVKQDPEMAFRLRKRAAEMGHTMAAGFMAQCYYTGYMVDKDQEDEIKWRRIAAKRGYAESRVNLGIIAMQNRNTSEGIEHFRAAAAQGCQKGVDEMRECFQLKLASKEQFLEALKSYQKAENELKDAAVRRDKACIEHLKATSYGPSAHYKDGKRIAK